MVGLGSNVVPNSCWSVEGDAPIKRSSYKWDSQYGYSYCALLQCWSFACGEEVNFVKYEHSDRSLYTTIDHNVN